MKRLFLSHYLFFFLIIFGSINIFSQDPQKNEDEVLKIDTSLIQTSVTVLDKKGKPVTDLNQSDFELRVDGKPVPLQFFEKFFSTNTQIDKGKAQKKTEDVVEIRPAPVSSRTFVFVIDDLHLSIASYKLVRDLVNKFTNEDMLPNDKVALVSTSGSIGFLEQFTSDKTVLKAALNRLSAANERLGADRSPPPMSEYEAYLINMGDEDVIRKFIDKMGASPSERAGIRFVIIARARAITSKTNAINRGTFTTIEESIRNTAEFPGRKTIFLISDGFILNHPESNALDYLSKIINTATRTNSVIYTFDAKGLEYERPFGERMELVDGLSNIAQRTGGKFIENTNDLRLSLPNIMEEISSYYVLAWEPPVEDGKSYKLKKIEVILKNRPDLKVQMQNGYLNNVPNLGEEKTKKTNSNESISVENADLRKAIVKHNPSQDIFTSVVANFVLNEENENVVAATVQLDVDEAEFIIKDEKAVAELDLFGIVFNSKGERVDSFNQALTISTNPSKIGKDLTTPIIFNHQTKLKPDLYQIRVAARGKKTARTGSANSWVNIPDISKPEIALSSLIINELRKDEKTVNKVSLQDNEVIIEANIDRKFSNDSTLRFLVYIYNSKNKKNEGKTPEVFLETSISTQNKIVLTSGQSPIQTTGVDTSRIPYIVEIPLNSLTRGFHELKVKVTEKITKKSDEKIIGFEIR